MTALPNGALARRPVRLGLALGVFTATAVIWLLPLVLHLRTSVLGDHPNDLTAGIRDYWAAEAQGESPFTLERDALIGAPEGVPRSPVITAANALQPAFVWLLKDAVGLVAAFNVFAITGLVLTAFAAFALLDLLGLAFLPALFGGYVFGFNTWLVAQAFDGHVGFLHAWVFPLLLLALFRLRRTRTAKSAVLAGAALAAVFYTTSYFALFGMFLVVLFTVTDLVSRGSRGARLWSFALLDVVALTALGLYAPVLVLWRLDPGSVAEAVSQPLSDLQKFGAQALGYFVPANRHPVLGGLAESLWPWRADWPFAGEQTFFFGYTTLVLAGMTAWRLLAGWHRDPEPQRVFVAAFGGVLVLAAFLLSLPRFVYPFGVAIPTPVWLMGEVTTYWRVYARFAVLVGLGLAILAAVALDRLMTRRRGALIGLGALVLVAFELAPSPRVELYSTDEPPAYARWLAARPRGIVAHYPFVFSSIDDPASRLSGEAYFNQMFHEHPLFTLYGGGVSGTRENAIRLLSRFPDDDAAGILAAAGVFYVLVHDDLYRARGEDPPKPPADDYRRLATLAGIRIFAVADDPDPVDVDDLRVRADVADILGLRRPTGRYAGSGFYPEELFSDGRLRRWLRQDGVVEVENSSSARSFLFTVLAFSASIPRRIELRDEDGRVLASAGVPTSETELELGPISLPPGRSRLVLHADPAPERLGESDPRVASVFLSGFAIRPLAEYTRSLRDE